MELTTLIVVVGFGVLIILLWMCRKIPASFPPGPIGLPLIGYYPFLGKFPHLKITNLGTKYGNVFSVPFGNTRVVVLNDWPAVKEALVNQKEIFNGRPRNAVLQEVTGYLGLSLSDGPKWRERRRFTVQHLKNLGVGKDIMETVIMTEINEMCAIMLSDVDKPVDIGPYFFPAFVNVVTAIHVSVKYDRNDPILADFMEIFDVVFNECAGTNPVNFMPFLRHIGPRYKAFLALNNKLNAVLNELLKFHESTYEEGNVRDFYDAYLKEIYQCEKNGKKTTSFTRDNLVMVNKEVIAAGVDTSHSTFLWNLIYMVKWPNIQRKVQEELDMVFGREGTPSYADRGRLNYTNAVLLEMFRYTSIACFALTHRTLADTRLFGYTLPKDTIVIPNLWAVHHDPKYWKDPYVFNPERFFNEDGQVVNPEYLVPFSCGGRKCVGEILAKASSFLFFTCILHRFSVSFPPGEKLPNLDPVYGIGLHPPPCSLVFKSRS